MSKARTTVTPTPTMIDDSNLSSAWARLLLRILDGAGPEVAPPVLSPSGFAEDGRDVEDPAVRRALDQLLIRKGRIVVDNVALTIFPRLVWETSRGDQGLLFARHRATFPRWQAIGLKANVGGIYFERMVRYGRGPCNGNQSELILFQFNSRTGIGRSMLQAITLDPSSDHVACAQLGTPWLQQGSSEPATNGLDTNAFYATQKIAPKAYGNHLGSSQLGAFMAQAMDMSLAHLKVMFGTAKLDWINKSHADLVPLVATARTLASPPAASTLRTPVFTATAGETL